MNFSNTLAFMPARSDLLIQCEELGEQILLGAEAVAGKDGGVERSLIMRLAIHSRLGVLASAFVFVSFWV